ncbi:aromatic ring-hydroxylating dioxygenase subunit alpha [Rhodococcus opacus]|nr:aromatic ring-hydroxylating dioxygenase subunit alpha [Rhodococcus opacus]
MTDMTEIDGDTERITASLTAGWQLPAMMYSDPAVYEQEQELIFPRAWQYVGCEKDLAEPGAYLTAQLGDLPIVVVRDRDGVLHGHVNVCRHRLHPVAEGTGCRQLFQCRYHGWTYTHDGSLRSAPGLRDEDAFDRQTLGLRPIQVETFRGFVFANPDVAAEPLAEYLGGAHALVDELNLDFADWEHGGTYTYDIPANWKLFTENALECYHCPLVHQDTYATAFHTTKANYQCTEFDNVAVQVAPVTELTERLAARGGLDGFRLLYLWPVSFLSVDDFVGMVARTVPLGSHSSRFVVDAFVKPGTDPAVLEQWLDIYDRTFAEDKTVVAAQQAGRLRSGTARPADDQLRIDHRHVPTPHLGRVGRPIDHRFTSRTGHTLGTDPTRGFRSRFAGRRRHHRGRRRRLPHSRPRCRWGPATVAARSPHRLVPDRRADPAILAVRRPAHH